MENEKMKMEYLAISSVPESIKDANYVEINRTYNQFANEINDCINSRIRRKYASDSKLPMYPERK